MDSMLDDVVKKYGLPCNQTKLLTAEDKDLVVSILSLTLLLWDNSTNRNLYNSYEHLVNLLGIDDVDVLYMTLRLLMKPSLRISAQKSLKAPFSAAQNMLQVLASRWPYPKLDLLDFLETSDSTMTEEDPSAPFVFSFYRTVQELKVLASGQRSEGPGTETASSREGVSLAAASVAKDESSFGGESPFVQGTATPVTAHVSITLPSCPPDSTRVLALYNDTKQTHFVSNDLSLDLLHKIRLHAYINTPSVRVKLLAIRLLSLVILTQVYSEDLAHSKLFLFEPDLIQKVAGLIIYEKPLPLQLRFIAISLMDGFAHYRGKVNEVLTAINASANHGHLMFCLRKIAGSSNEQGRSPRLMADVDFNLEFVDALYSFISFVLATQTGGNMLITAGIIFVLAEALNNHAEAHLKVCRAS
ncbi:hypothetical protein HDU91_006035 [Kappamyces sp. JEL0680]|nr:hypothetical protein HDU91_006035 [Kappamyces sp. JEL0680]